MNRVVGRVVLQGTEIGVPRVRIAVYDTTPTHVSTPGATQPPPQEGPGDESRWTPWGSVITDVRGAFAVTHDDAAGARSRPNLALVVSAAEETCAKPQARIATCVRPQAGETESFLIALSRRQLDEAGLRAPGDSQDVKDEIERQRVAARRREALRTESRRRFVERLSARREFERIAESKMEAFMSALSAVPIEQRTPAARYVPKGSSIAAAHATVVRSAISHRINRATATGRVALSDAEAARFKGADGEFVTLDSSASPERRLWPNHFGRGRLREVPAALLCREDPVDPCVKLLEDLEAAGDDHPGDEEAAPAPGPSAQEPVVGGIPADVPALIANLVNPVTPPESASIFGTDTRAAIGDVEAGVKSFTLHSGPADAPAMYDFHHLQIAFEHVWQELFDDGVVSTAKDLYTQLVELGVDPNEYLIDPDEQSYNSWKIKITLPSDGGLEDPLKSVITEFDITAQQWGALSEDLRGELEAITTNITDQKKARDEQLAKITALFNSLAAIIPVPPAVIQAVKQTIREQFQPVLREERQRGERIIRYADHKLEAPEHFEQFHPLLKQLDAAMKEPHRFSIFAANRRERSVNFGIVATYRQKWVPDTYQVGKLVKTLPLAPKEVRRFTKKVTTRKSRAEKEVENSVYSRKTESTETVRVETQIVQKAQNKTNFQLNAQGGVNIGIANASGSTAFQQSAATESQEVKKEFRSAVFKAAEEYKSERTTEINVGTGEETGFEESGEISNPNDEIPVTYLFYELQRRYDVSEQLQRVTPVVLVAQEFPKPNQIDEDWIVAHDWILRRVILDDSFIPAMNYLSSKVVGDEVSLQEMYQNLQQQRRLLEDLKEELVELQRQSGRRYAALQKSVEERAQALDAEEAEGFLSEGVEGLFGGTDASPEALKVREDAAKDAYDRAVKQERDKQAHLERELTALNSLTETYTRELSDHLNRKAQISRLRVHLKANIMYYMQAIWSSEPPDQRFFRLHQVRVPKLQGTMTYTLEPDPDDIPMPPDWKPPYKLSVKCALDEELEFETLAEVADLDNLLGFKGNYMIFPLKKTNALTDFMMIPYLDAVTGIRDPDPLGNWSLSDFIKYTCCLYRHLPKTRFDKLLPGLQAAYQRLFNTAGADGEKMIVPTDSLYIEALPGAHPILEDFKLFHRVVDVKKVQADVRAAELENLRAAARLLAGEREDPTIEKKVVIEGATSIAVTPEPPEPI
jgi:hypothetical protein